MSFTWGKGTNEAQKHIAKESWKTFTYSKEHQPQVNAAPNTDSPPVRGSRALLPLTNKYRPYSEATSILEIACGPATLYSILFSDAASMPLAPSAELLATDISTPMIEQIHSRQATAHPGEEKTWARIKAWEADATNLSTVFDSSQSHVLSQMGIFLVPDSDACLREVKRVMKKDGSAIFGMSSMAEATWNTDIFGWIEKLHPDRKLPSIPQKWRTAEGFKAELGKHGFERVEVEPAEIAIPFEDARQTIDGMWRMMPFVPAVVDGLSDEQIEEIKATAAKHITEKFPGKKLPGRILIGVGF